ncbi:MAG: RNA polymerase sigma-70 factor (ECF subfamily) [Saprospiraceae bacterium]|jgi:RNA polymerase sigma-70 factor (ECF subfamily)
MNILTLKEEKILLQRIKESDDTAFRQLFDAYYKYLTVTAYRYLHESEKAKDMAQDAFVELWNRRETLTITFGVKAYLRQAVVNKCLNYIKREKRIDFSENALLPETPTAPEATDNLEYEDTRKTVQDAIDTLPERCRIIFCMSRFDEKSHKEIAAELNISTKTIENQITRALKTLRSVLSVKALAFLAFIQLL